MERNVIFHENQENLDTDMNNIGAYARDSIDHVVHDAIDSGRKFWNFPVVKTGPLEVNVGEGRYYNNGKVFIRNDDGGVTLPLADFAPAVTKKIITIAVWGNEVETDMKPVNFLTNVDTGKTESKVVARTSLRSAEINSVPGLENANPQPPALDANVLAIAYVTMSPSGIEEIKMVEDNRIVSSSKNAAAIKQIDGWMTSTGKRIDTLDTDMAALASGIKGTVRQEEFFNATADIARIKNKLEMPDGLSYWAADHFLSREQSDTDSEHPDTMCKVEEGLRFSNHAERQANINLLNPLEPRVKLTGNFALPDYKPRVRLDLSGKDGEIILSQYPIQTPALVEKKRSRTRLRYGGTMSVCTNAAWWRSGSYDPVTGIFRRAGETWEVNPEDRGRTGINHQMIRVTQFWYDSYTEAYWEAVVEEFGVRGAIAGQSFLNAQDGWLTNIDLFFSQVAATGDIHVMITETTNGAPDLKKIISRVTLPVDSIQVHPKATNIPIGPVFLTKERYALVLVTEGSHVACTVDGNKYGQGQYFYSGDGGGWFMGDSKIDLAMRLYFAEFTSTRAEVQIESWLLDGGIVAVDIMAESYVPEGCELAWQIRVDGNWRTLGSGEGNLLNGLVPQYEARVVFIGTTDLMPSLTFGAASTIETSRPRTDYRHVTKPRMLEAPVNIIEVRLRLESWEKERHDCVVDLLTGDGFKTPIAASNFEDRKTEDPAAIERRFYFDVENISAYRLRTKGTTDNVMVTYHVAERVDMARMSN